LPLLGSFSGVASNAPPTPKEDHTWDHKGHGAFG
jgi:hypothetical protein